MTIGETRVYKSSQIGAQLKDQHVSSTLCEVWGSSILKQNSENFKNPSLSFLSELKFWTAISANTMFIQYCLLVNISTEQI